MLAWIRDKLAALRHGFADLLRGLTRCLFPVAIYGTWVGVLWGDQARDVLRAAFERAALQDSYSRLGALAVATALLGLSIWYAMRCLLSLQSQGLPLPAPTPRSLSTWTPRVLGASVALWPAGFIHGLLASTEQDDPRIDATLPAGARLHAHVETVGQAVTVGFIVLAFALFVFFWMRATLFDLGRTAPPQLARQAALPPPMLRAVFWCIVSMVLCSVLVMNFPLSLARVVGSAALLALALACINIVGSFVLTFWPLRSNMPILAPWALVWALCISPLTDNHAPLAASLAPVSDAGHRKTVGQAFGDWLDARQKRDPLHGGRDAPVYVVATEGGGVRAGYWTALTLEKLARVPGLRFEQDLFAISSVSGGSVGAGFWVAGLQSRRCGPPPRARADVASRALKTDFLAPAVGFLLFPDLMQRFIPFPIAAANRSRALEEGWERAFGMLPQNPMMRSIDQLYADCDALPELLLNATVAESGRRAVLSHMSTTGLVDVFNPAASTDPSTDHQHLSGVIHHSARFPVISPPGSVIDLKAPQGRAMANLLDGGYFDNSGIVTALEVIRMMRRVSDSTPIALIVIADSAYQECVRSDTSYYCAKPVDPPGALPPEQTTKWFNEPLPIFDGLYRVRDSHVHEALYGGMGQVPIALIDRPHAKGDVIAPTGWALSESVTKLMDRESDNTPRTLTPPPAASGPCSATPAKQSTP